jgi:hypothetical protein
LENGEELRKSFEIFFQAAAKAALHLSKVLQFL